MLAGTRSGKTTLLNCLAVAIPGTDRISSAEEAFWNDHLLGVLDSRRLHHHLGGFELRSV